MHLDPYVMIAGLIVGFTVGLTGMGGGALMTPILVLLFKVQPLAAVSSDLVAALVMKPVGAGVHMRKGTVKWSLVRWLCLGSVPAAAAPSTNRRQSGSASRKVRPYTFVSTRGSRMTTRPVSVRVRISRPNPCFNLIAACGR